MNLPDWISRSENVLVAPLNWGLGHATRCIPIIKKLISQGKTVVLASDGNALELLKKEFPQITLIKLPGYNIRYNYPSITVNILRHGIDILKAIRCERDITENIVNHYGIDTIISDNRYGVRSNQCKNVIICHQINIKDGNRLAASLGSKLNKYWINKFDECWIPDNPPPHSLAGDLSLPANIYHHHYLGPLSRFNVKDVNRKRQLLIILSGPEPKRTQLEHKLFSCLQNIDFLMIRGVISDSLEENENVKNYLTSKELNKEICASELVICRSGYSSIMDLVKLKKQAILIPTAGQGEQEYLAYWHSKQKQSPFKIIKESDIENIASMISSD